MKKVNAAVIGLGNMGKNHVRVLSSLSSVKLVGVCDNNRVIAKRVAEMYNTNYFSDYSELAKKNELDMVVIATPTSLHKDVACEFIENDKHVLVEKPIAADVKDAQKIVRLAEKKDVKLLVGHIERFNPAVNRLKEIIKQGLIGDLISIQAKRIGPQPPRKIDVSVTVDLAIHDIDIIANYILERRKIRQIYALTKAVLSEYSDIVHAVIEFEGGVGANLTANWLTPAKIRKLEVVGNEGYLVLDYISQDIRFYKRSSKNMHKREEGISMEVRKIFVKREEPLKRELTHFIDVILNDEQPQITGWDAINALKIAKEIEMKSQKR